MLAFLGVGSAAIRAQFGPLTKRNALVPFSQARKAQMSNSSCCLFPPRLEGQLELYQPVELGQEGQASQNTDAHEALVLS